MARVRAWAFIALALLFIAAAYAKALRSLAKRQRHMPDGVQTSKPMIHKYLADQKMPKFSPLYEFTKLRMAQQEKLLNSYTSIEWPVDEQFGELVHRGSPCQTVFFKPNFYKNSVGDTLLHFNPLLPNGGAVREVNLPTRELREQIQYLELNSKRTPTRDGLIDSNLQAEFDKIESLPEFAPIHSTEDLDARGIMITRIGHIPFNKSPALAEHEAAIAEADASAVAQAEYVESLKQAALAEANEAAASASQQDQTVTEDVELMRFKQVDSQIAAIADSDEVSLEGEVLADPLTPEETAAVDSQMQQQEQSTLGPLPGTVEYVMQGQDPNYVDVDYVIDQVVKPVNAEPVLPYKTWPKYEFHAHRTRCGTSNLEVAAALRDLMVTQPYMPPFAHEFIFSLTRVDNYKSDSAFMLTTWMRPPSFVYPDRTLACLHPDPNKLILDKTVPKKRPACWIDHFTKNYSDQMYLSGMFFKVIDFQAKIMDYLTDTYGIHFDRFVPPRKDFRVSYAAENLSKPVAVSENIITIAYP